MSDVDIHRLPLRTAELLLATSDVAVICTWMIYAWPGAGHRAVMPASDAEFAASVGVVFFKTCTVPTIPNLFQREPVVSIGPRGIYDRRHSTDWMPWKAITRITSGQIRRQRRLALEIVSSADASLPRTN